MLKFIYTGSTAPSSYVASEVRQIVDLRPFKADISEGLAVVAASAYFNRVAGGPQTDTAFSLDIRAYVSGVGQNRPVRVASK